MNQIMKASSLEIVQNRMEIIHPSHFDLFVAKVLSWYQVSTAAHDNENSEEFINHNYIPNVFSLFEYPGVIGEQIYFMFLDSETQNRMDNFNESYPVAKDAAMRLINDDDAVTRFRMQLDVKEVLNVYRMFYCYQDDAHDSSEYYNPYTTEVW